MFVNLEKNKAFSSIGVSCLSEVQLIKRFNIWKGKEPDPQWKGYRNLNGPFDTLGVTPDGLLEILNYIKTGQIIEVMGNKDNYDKEVQLEGDIFFRHKTLTGVFLSHEGENLDDIKEKMEERFKNFLSLPKDTVLIWSNTQGNWNEDLSVCSTTIGDYHLTKDRYIQISQAVSEILGYRVKFAVKEPYLDYSLLKESNVHIINVEGTKLFGSKQDYDKVFEGEE
jgi:hypothetical protein